VSCFEPRRAAGWWLAIAVLVAACQPLPQPNKPDSKSRDFGGLLDLGPRAGLVVTPPTGFQDDTGIRFADALALSLQALDVAATARKSHRASYILAGSVKTTAPRQGLMQVVFDWRVIDPRGMEVARTEQVEILQETQWPPNDAQRLRALAAAAADAVGGIIGLDPDVPPPTSGAAIAIASVLGAPGDGNRALAAAMRRALRAQGARISDTQGDAAFALRGIVKISDAGRDRQRVEIEWIVSNAVGEDIGTSSQANFVPLGAVDARWGPIAEAAAEAGAEGILHIVKSGAKKG